MLLDIPILQCLFVAYIIGPFFSAYTCVLQGVMLSADNIPGNLDGDNVRTICSNVTDPEYTKEEMKATKSKTSTVDGEKASKERFVLARLIIGSLLEVPDDLLAFAWKASYCSGRYDFRLFFRFCN